MADGTINLRELAVVLLVVEGAATSQIPQRVNVGNSLGRHTAFERGALQLFELLRVQGSLVF